MIAMTHPVTGGEATAVSEAQAVLWEGVGWQRVSDEPEPDTAKPATKSTTSKEKP